MTPKRAIKVRRWTPDDISAIVECHIAAYGDYTRQEHYDRRLHQMQLAAFPEGQFLAEADGKVVGYATSLLVQLDDDAAPYTFSEITGGGTFKTHDPGGDTLYGADIAVRPEYRGQGIAGLLYRERRKLMKRHNLRRMVAYGRIPGFAKYEGKMTADDYVKQVVAGKLKDSALNAHLKAGYEVKRVLLDFMKDRSSLNYSTLLELLNADFRPEKRRIMAGPLKRPVRKVRVCASQWLMRKIATWEEFEQTVEFFVDTADTYFCHFLVFPELFTAQLFSTFPPDTEYREAMERLADMTDRYLEMFCAKAKERKIYIIGGSHPVMRDGELYNVAHLFTPTGHVYTQDKLHITASEREYWNFQPGEELRIFDTPLGRIAIQICYDIEFPEASRLLTLAGAEIIFVPFSTDEKKAYYRVRYAAHARAVENYLYVVLSGNVGNLPSVKSYLLNYGQAAILTPSDFAFPREGILGEAEPNVETVVISEIDLTSLTQQRGVASVRPLYDRRPDLYELRANHPVRVVRVE